MTTTKIHKIAIQNVCKRRLAFSKKILSYWATSVLSDLAAAEITLRIVESLEIRQLNNQYRNQDKPTNVLAFPSELPDFIPLKRLFLGDIIICPEILLQESLAQKKPLDLHWAHIIVHGILHLLGYDHQSRLDTKTMQTKEITLLARLGFANPYSFEDHYFE